MAWPLARWFTRSALPARPTGPALEAANWARWQGTRTTTADPTLAAGTVRQRARFHVANDPWCANAAAGWRDGLIGAGITPASLAPDAAAREAIASAWGRWVDRADADERTDYYGLQGLVAQTVVVDGEALVFMPPGRELRLRCLPIDRLETSLTRSLAGGQIIAGIEFDSEGRRVAYHLRPDDLSLSTIRIPATDLLHVYRGDAPGQVRGLSWFAPVLLTVNELSQLTDALLVGQKVAAMHAGFLVDMNSTGPAPFVGDQSGSQLNVSLEPGVMRVLPSGFDVKFSSPQQVSTGIDLARINIRAIAAGLQLPEYVVSGDLSQANYSSLRSGLMHWKRRLDALQFHMLAPQLLTPIWRRWLTLEILAGRIDAPGFEDNPESWLAVEHYPAPLPWIDPLKDAEGEVALIAAGLKSRRQAVAERGYDVAALDQEIAADRQREKSLGLDFTTAPSPQTGGNQNA